MRATSVIGTLRVEDGKGVVRMEDTYSTGVADLWSAISEPDRLARWLGTMVGEARLGGTLQARFTSGWEGEIRVDACEVERRILVTSGVGEPDQTVIEATLTAVGDRTRLVIEERGITTSELSAYGAGWQAHVEDLGTHLAGGEPGEWVARWRELTPEYEVSAGELPS